MILLGYRDEYSHVPLGKQGESDPPHSEAGLSPLIDTLLFDYVRARRRRPLYKGQAQIYGG